MSDDQRIVIGNPGEQQLVFATEAELAGFVADVLDTRGGVYKPIEIKAVRRLLELGGTDDPRANQPVFRRGLLVTERLDPALVMAELGEEERRAVASWCETLGLREADWPAVPPLRGLLEAVAVFRVAPRMATEARGDAIRWAAEELGVEGDAGRTHPGDRYAMAQYRWYRAAVAARDRQNVENGCGEVV